MLSSPLQRMRNHLTTRRGRGLWLALALLLLALQTALPAHLMSHHLGQAPDVHCQYCVLGGHLYSPTSSAPPLVVTTFQLAVPQVVPAAQTPAPYPRTVFSRGPPSAIDA